jgi:hypothetical protein
VPLGDDGFLSLVSRIDDEETVEGEIVRDGRAEPILAAQVTVLEAADGLTPERWRIEAVSRSGPVRVFGQVTAAVPVIRPGRVLFHFGLARFDADGRTGHGTFETARRLGAGSEADAEEE